MATAGKPEGAYSAEYWGNAPAVYDDHTLKIAGRDVMEDWEQGYMDRLAAVASSGGGAVLELGFGMGISARAIQSHGVESHTVIECHPDVLQRCIADFRNEIAANRLHVYSGFWQNVTPTLADGTFDGILFDTYPLHDKEYIGPHKFFFEEAHRLLKVGGVLTYYSDEATAIEDDHLERLVTAGFKEEDVAVELCPVSPPEGCEYWHEDTIVVPVVRKS